MACFVVPGAEAVVATAAALVVKKVESKKLEAPKLEGASPLAKAPAKVTWSRRLFWLSGLLWGGVALLAFEHFWHGEVVPYAPFLTAMYSKADTAEMLHEMATVGTTMAVAVTAVWGGICAVANRLAKRTKVELKEAEVEG